MLHGLWYFNTMSGRDELRRLQPDHLYPNQVRCQIIPLLFMIALVLLYQYDANKFTSSSASFAFELEASKFSRNWFAVLGELIWCNSITGLIELVAIKK